MKKNMKTRDKKCRKNIRNLLSLMGFKDNNIAVSARVKNMLAKLRGVEEINDINKCPTATTGSPVAVHMNKNMNHSTIKRVVFKLGGKRCVLVQELSHSKTPATIMSRNKKLELKDTRNINPSGESCGSKMMFVGDHEHDVIKKADKINILKSRSPNVKKDSRDSLKVSSRKQGGQEDDDDDVVMMEFNNGEISDSRNNALYSENPVLNMIHDDELKVNNVKDFIISIGGKKTNLFIKKQLTSTDVSKNQGRLLMPGKQVQNSDEILTPNEKIILDNKKDVSVSVFDPQKREWELNLGQWSMGINVNYVLKKKWKDFVTANGLKQDINIQVWSFRDVAERLCFAVVRS